MGAPNNNKVPRQHTNTKGLIPAGARAGSDKELLSSEDLAANLRAIDTFAASIGGRQGLLDTLAVAGSAPECEKVVNLLLDPRYESWSLRRLCGIAGITIADLFAGYKKAMIVKAHIEAVAIIASHLPPIVEDVMKRAAPTEVLCPDCGGNPRKVAACTACGGTGRSVREPELDRQKLALELGQLLEKRGGLSIVQQNLNAGQAAIVSSGPLEQLKQAVCDLLFGPGRQRAGAPPDLDATPSPDEPPAA